MILHNGTLPWPDPPSITPASEIDGPDDRSTGLPAGGGCRQAPTVHTVDPYTLGLKDRRQ